MHRDELVKYISELLETARFSDYGPNGVQIEGRARITKIVTGVSASVELFERAINMHADAVIVHHGIIWNFERPVYRGGYKNRVKLLLENDINLLAYHLPLDAHMTFGNAAQIADKLGLQELRGFGEYKGNTVGVKGTLSAKAFSKIADNIQA